MYDIVEFAAVITVAKEIRDKYDLKTFLSIFADDSFAESRCLDILSDLEWITQTYKRDSYNPSTGEYVWEWIK